MHVLNLICKSYKGSKFLYVKLDYLNPTQRFDAKVVDVLIINTSVCMTQFTNSNINLVTQYVVYISFMWIELPLVISKFASLGLKC